MATRVKSKVYSNVSLDQAQEASRLFATAQNQLAKIEAKMNEEINKVRSRYQEQVNDLTEQTDDPKKILEAFAKEQQESWGKKKSFDLLHSVIGFRTGMPKLKCGKGFNWTSVTELLKEHFPEYVRTVDEPNKELLISDREDEKFEAISKKVHISVVQDETFYVEPKVQEVAPV